MPALPHPSQLLRASLLSITLLAALALAAPAALAAAPTALGDFDGDGISDLAVGAPADSVSGQPQAGAVNVIYGAAGGLSEVGDQQFTKMPQQVAGAPQPDARFGAALAAGDIDGDRFGDLAIGAPGEDVGGLGPQPDSGAVTVLYGSPGGLRTRPAVGGWTQSSIGIKGNAEGGDRFGAALTLADFDGDGRDDLAIGAPGDSVDGSADAGAVNVLNGTAGGLSGVGDQLWTQGSGGIKGAVGDDRFGSALASGEPDQD